MLGFIKKQVCTLDGENKQAAAMRENVHFSSTLRRDMELRRKASWTQQFSSHSVIVELSIVMFHWYRCNTTCTMTLLSYSKLAQICHHLLFFHKITMLVFVKNEGKISASILLRFLTKLYQKSQPQKSKKQWVCIRDYGTLQPSAFLRWYACGSRLLINFTQFWNPKLTKI